MKSIIMNAEEINAFRAGCKTQFRRAVKPQPILGKPWKDWIIDPEIVDLPTAYCPFGIGGDKLWVRETFSEDLWIAASMVLYKADYPDGQYINKFTNKQVKWKSPVVMRKWVSRITLEITNVRIEQLQNITIEDVLSEGIKAPDWLSNIDSWHDPDDVMIEIYAEYWNAHFKPDQASNPWVFVISFKKLDKKPE